MGQLRARSPRPSFALVFCSNCSFCSPAGDPQCFHCQSDQERSCASSKSKCEADCGGHYCAFDEAWTAAPTPTPPVNDGGEGCECRSASEVTSDAWCWKTECAKEYVDAGFCAYKDADGVVCSGGSGGGPGAPGGGGGGTKACDKDSVGATCASGPLGIVEDAWCIAVACAETYVASGHCMFKCPEEAPPANTLAPTPATTTTKPPKACEDRSTEKSCDKDAACKWKAGQGKCVVDGGATTTTAAPTTAAPPATTTPDWTGTIAGTHYWDCNGQACDATVLSPWDSSKYLAAPGYGPQDPDDHGGAAYGERMWLTGAASDPLSELLGDADDCCGDDDGGHGGCGKCVLFRNPDAVHADWTAVIMKKNRCPTDLCSKGAHFDVAVPGYDVLEWSWSNVCGDPGTGFESRAQSEAAGRWYETCADTLACIDQCDGIPEGELRAGCRLFASWGWTTGTPAAMPYRLVDCPPAFVAHVSSLFDENGIVPGGGAVVDATTTTVGLEGGGTDSCKKKTTKKKCRKVKKKNGKRKCSWNKRKEKCRRKKNA